MPFLVHPLIEKPVEISPGGVFERALQILGDYVAAAMTRAIEIERLVEEVVAGDAPEHMQDQAALLIQMTIEQLDWGAIAIAHDWPAIVIGVLVEIAFAILADVPCELVGPEILLAPERLEVS